MAVNGSELINHPWNTSLSPFIDLLGTPFYVIPLSIIGVALLVKTKEPVYFGLYLLTMGLLLSAASVMNEIMGMVPLYIIVIAAGFTSLIIGLIMKFGE